MCRNQSYRSERRRQFTDARGLDQHTKRERLLALSDPMKPHTRVDCEEMKHPGWRIVPLVGLVLIQGALAMELMTAVAFDDGGAEAGLRAYAWQISRFRPRPLCNGTPTTRVA